MTTPVYYYFDDWVEVKHADIDLGLIDDDQYNELQDEFADYLMNNVYVTRNSNAAKPLNKKAAAYTFLVVLSVLLEIAAVVCSIVFETTVFGTVCFYIAMVPIFAGLAVIVLGFVAFVLAGFFEFIWEGIKAIYNAFDKR